MQLQESTGGLYNRPLFKKSLIELERYFTCNSNYITIYKSQYRYHHNLVISFKEILKDRFVVFYYEFMFPSSFSQARAINLKIEVVNKNPNQSIFSTIFTMQ